MKLITLQPVMEIEEETTIPEPVKTITVPNQMLKDIASRMSHMAGRQCAMGNLYIAADLLLQNPSFVSKGIPSVRNAYVDMELSSGRYTITDRDEMRRYLAMKNWLFPVCRCCERDDPSILYYPCKQCYLYMYCSEECLAKDRQAHSAYCGNADAPADPTRAARAP